LYEHSLAIYRELGDMWESANTLDALGWLDVYLGAYPQARARHEEALAVRRTLGGPKTIAASLHGLGAMVGLQGEYEEAERLLRECITIWRELDDRAGIERGLNQLGPGLLFFGRFAEGISMLEEALALCDELGLYAKATRANTFLGFGALHLSDYEHARTKADIALASARELGAVENIARSYWLLGDIALATEAYAKAVGWFQESAAIYHEYALPHEVAFVLADLAMAFCGLGQFAEARKCLHEAVLTATAVRSVFSFIPVLPAAALLLDRLGEPQRAVEIYASALRDPYVANSHWYSDVVGRHIAAVAETLPPDVGAAARARGKARDLEATAEELLGELGGEDAG
jgi:tetratricopeptide (TPR) repeat protein